MLTPLKPFINLRLESRGCKHVRHGWVDDRPGATDPKKHLPRDDPRHPDFQGVVSPEKAKELTIAMDYATGGGKSAASASAGEGCGAKPGGANVRSSWSKEELGEGHSNPIAPKFAKARREFFSALRQKALKHNQDDPWENDADFEMFVAHWAEATASLGKRVGTNLVGMGDQLKARVLPAKAAGDNKAFAKWVQQYRDKYPNIWSQPAPDFSMDW